MNSMKTAYDRRLVGTATAICLLISLPLSALIIREVAAQTTHEAKIAGLAFVPQNLTVNPQTEIESQSRIDVKDFSVT